MIITNLLCRHKHMHVQITQLNYLMAIKKERRNLLFDKQTIKKNKEHIIEFFQQWLLIHLFAAA